MTTPYGISTSKGSQTFQGYVNAPIIGPLDSSQYPNTMQYHSYGILTGQRPTPPQFFPGQEPVYAEMSVNARAQYLRATALSARQKAIQDALGKLTTPITKVSYSTQRQYPVSSHVNYIAPIPGSMYTNILKSILGTSDADVTIEYNDSNATFSFESYILTCRLIDGKYPNYEAVIPKENPNQMQVSRVSFLNSVRRVSIFSNKTTHQIRLKIAGAALQISAEDFDYSNSAEERLDCDYQGDDIQIGFNSRFLIEMLNNMECDQIKLSMSLPNRAGILTPLDNTEEGEHITMLVMPVMLNE